MYGIPVRQSTPTQVWTPSGVDLCPNRECHSPISQFFHSFYLLLLYLQLGRLRLDEWVSSVEYSVPVFNIPSYPLAWLL